MTRAIVDHPKIKYLIDFNNTKQTFAKEKHVNTKTQLILYFISFFSVATSLAQTPPGGNPPDSLANRATQFCLKESSTNRLIDQPMDRGNCSALLVAGAAAAYFSGNEELGMLLITSNQRQWALNAIKLSCIGGDIANQAAIRLIQACNCHDPSSQQAIENNQWEALQVLKIRSGGHPGYPGCEDYPPYYGKQ